MAISFVGSSTGTTSATLPAHQAGDLILAFAYRDGSATSPALGSGFTNLLIQAGTSNSCRVGYLFATGSSTSSGTWTSSTSVIFLVYRGVSSIGAFGSTFNTGTLITFPSLSLVAQTGKSWVVGFVGHRSNNVAIETAPSGMVNRTSVSDSTDEAAAHDTNLGVDVFEATTSQINGSSSGWVSSTIELIDGNISVSINGIELKTLQYLLPKNADWHSWLIDEKVIYAIGEQSAEIQIEGIELNSDFSELLFDASSNLTIDGIETFAIADDISITISDSEIVNGIEAVSFSGQATATANAYFEQAGLSTKTDFSEISASADANSNISGNVLNALFDDVLANADSVYVISGNEATTEIGEVTANTIVIVNASTEIDGIEASASIGDISAISESPETWSGGQIKRYPSNQFVSATAKVESLTSKAEIGKVKPNATTIINATISLDNVVSFVQASDINASGTLEISDEELILLLAA